MRLYIRYTAGMKTSLTEGQVAQAGDGRIFFTIKETQAHFLQKLRDDEGRTIGHGQFILHIDAIALQGTVYIPLSLASGKKITGFVYQIEGTAEGTISTANITCRGKGITQVTLGTLLYAKIPQGSTASFNLVVDVKGGIGKTFKVVVNRVNYKLNPSDARYKKFDVALATKALKFK